MDYFGSARKLDERDIVEVSEKLQVHPAVLSAVVQIESSGSGFLPDKRPKILYEAHVFNRLTKGAYLASTTAHKDPLGNSIASKRWNKSLYGKPGAWQYVRMGVAEKLSQEAAQKATSWGMFQIMGMNHEACGYVYLEAFIEDMKRGEREQLDAFAKFIQHSNLVDELQDQRWAEFAEEYNGPGYADNQYDRRLKAAYSSLVATWTDRLTVLRGDTHRYADFNPTDRENVRKVQAVLNSMKIVNPPLAVDGWLGSKTFEAIRMYNMAVHGKNESLLTYDLFKELVK